MFDVKITVQDEELIKTGVLINYSYVFFDIQHIKQGNAQDTFPTLGLFPKYPSNIKGNIRG